MDLKRKPATARTKRLFFGMGVRNVEKGWTVVGGYGAYYDSFSRTRRAAIQSHVAATGRSWDACVWKGDFVTRSELRLLPNKRKSK
jgi:hypothetical protein